MNGIRIESRVLAPPGGFSSVSFGSESTNVDKYKGHNFNPKTQKKVSEQHHGEENARPVKCQNGNTGIPGLETQHPVKPQRETQTQQHSQVQKPQQQEQFPGRRGRGGGESTFSLGWE